MVTGILLAVGTLGGTIPPWIKGQIGEGHTGGMIMILVLALMMIGLSRLLPYHGAQERHLSWQ